MVETYNSVSCSREGDIFHYRWAARRCLKLLDFNTTLEYITIEGPSEPIEGELVIDVAEYSCDENNNKLEPRCQILSFAFLYSAIM